MPYSTVERVDCMVAEQYNVSFTARRIPRFQRNAATSLGLQMVLEGIMASAVHSRGFLLALAGGRIEA